MRWDACQAVLTTVGSYEEAKTPEQINGKDETK